MFERKTGRYDLIDFFFMVGGALVVFMLVFSMALFTRDAFAGNETDGTLIRVKPGAATLIAPKINVTVVYAGDDDGDNTVKVEWGLDGGSYTGSNTSGPHPVSPYTYTIAALDNNEIYQVRVTLNDHENAPVDVVKEVTGQKPYSPLVHNAVSTGSGVSKWDNAGAGWGTADAGSQYGEFSCNTCHERKSGNIKRIRKDWSASPAVPVNIDAESINFQTNVDGFALDDSTDHSTSDRICEACHTLTNHHRHDSSTLATNDHKSSSNCTNCHLHKNAFGISGGCSGCHGGSITTSGSGVDSIWPGGGETTDSAGSVDDDGLHTLHLTELASRIHSMTLQQLADDSDSLTKQKGLCEYCHSGNTDDDDHAVGDDAEVFVADISSVATRKSLSFWGADSDATYSGGSCSAVDCHNNTSVNVAWYSAPSSSCTMCHTTGGTVNPTSGLHAVTPAVTGKIHDSSIAGGCAICHVSLTSQTTHIDGTNHDGSGETVQMGLAGFYSQSADNTGTCDGTGCHFEVNGGLTGSSDDWPHEWDSNAGFYTNATTSCAGCHGDWTNGWNGGGLTHIITAGTTAKHGTGTNYNCKDCHNIEGSGYTFTFPGTDWNPVNATSTHGDGNIQINNVTGYNDGTGYCVNCHTSGAYNFTDTAWAISAVAGDPILTTCGECHKGGAAPGSISLSHTAHGIINADIADGGAKCVICHSDSEYQNTFANGHGNGLIDLRATRITAYPGGQVKWDNSESTCTNSCHATSDPAGPVWDVANTLACDQCHYYAATPVSANNIGTGAIGGGHNVHFDAPAIDTCVECHPDNSGESAPYAHIDGTTLLEKSREGIISNNADMTPLGVAFNDSAKTCDNAACHNPSGGYVSPAWTSSATGCNTCHSNVKPATDSHAAHIDASTNFGIAPDCDSCHPSRTGAADHLDKVVQVEVLKNGSLDPIADPTALNGCGTNDCHNDGTSLTTGTPADYTWGTPITDCTECHGDATTQTSNAHNEHLAYLNPACTDCHTVATAATHIDTNINIASGETTYSRTATVAIGGTPNGTCATISCHNQGGASVAWNVGAGDIAGTTALTCDSCHYFDAPATSVGNTLSASHGDHFDAGKVCTQCHGDLPTTTAHINNRASISLTDGAIAEQDEAGMDWTHVSSYTDYTLAVDNSCGSATNNGLGCHATGTPDWDLAFDGSTCTPCHTDTATSAVNPTSGLHGTTNLLKHNGSFNTNKTCTSCHDTATPSNYHQDGTLQNGGAATYTWNTTFMAAGYVRATDDCAATCHTDSGSWNREWSGAVDAAWDYADDATSATVCGNCHGSFATGWNIVGSTSHDNPDVDNNPATLADSKTSHGECSLCHAWGHASYISGTKHENDTLEMNSTLDTSTGDGNCTTTCHAGQTLTMDANSGWTDAFVAGDGVSCGGCHAGGVTEASATGAHTVHGATAASVAADPASIALCVSCHGEDGTGGTHNDGNLDFSGVTYSTAVRNDETGTCSTTNCHNQGTDQSTAWNSTALACDDCHYYEVAVTDNTNNSNHAASLSNRHDSHFDQGVQCATCHTVPAAEDTTHIDGATDLADKATAAFDEAAVGGSKTITYTSPNCTANFAGVGCHATAASEEWTQAADTIVCTDCHTDTATPSVNPTSGLHATTNLTDHDATLSVGTGDPDPCEMCHTAIPSGSHVDGTLDTPATWDATNIPAGYDSSNDYCAATCHSDGGTWNREWSGAVDTAWGYTDDAASATVCGNCHGSFATEWNIVGDTSHDNPDADNDPDTLATSKSSHGECSSCHAWGHANYSTGTMHENDTLEMNATLDTTPGDGNCTSSCHAGQTLTMAANSGWTDASVAGDGVSCDVCHGGSGQYWPNGAAYPDRLGRHDQHVAKLAAKLLITLPGTETEQKQMCDYCHNDASGAGGNGHDADVGGDTTVEVGAFNTIGDASADAGSVYVADGCNSIACHNNKDTGTTTFGWYDVGTSTCLMCHSRDNSNVNALVDPTSGLHYSASSDGVVADSNGALLHDDSFTGGGTCLTCHDASPSVGHGNGVPEDPAQTTFNFKSDATVDIKLYNKGVALSSPSEGLYTCAATCHSDTKNWYRFWSADAFDGTAFDTSDSAAVTATFALALPPNCNACHGEFINGWAEGTAHYNMDQDNKGLSGGTHNSKDLSVNPGAACADCHLYPDHITPGQGLARHENAKITLTDDVTDPDDYTPYDDQEGIRTGVYCADCHEASVSPRDGNDANTFEYSLAFPGWANVEIVPSDRNPIYTCFSGATGCHGDTSNNWWPNIDSSDPVSYPNREGAHYEHGTTIGELLAAQYNSIYPDERDDLDDDGRVDATQEDRNKTCNFCHPMAWNAAKEVWESLYHRKPTPEIGVIATDVFGGYIFPGADKTGVYLSGDPAGDTWTDIDTDETTGYAYQLEVDPFNPGMGDYPLDHDGKYWQYLDTYNSASSVRHGVCSNVACHSNSPFTPQWYGDDQAPGQITNLSAYTHNQNSATLGELDPDHDTYEWDEPGSVRLYWTATGDNGYFSGTADEYKVYYRLDSDGPITATNTLDSPDGKSLLAGGAPTVLRQGNAQEMMVEGLTPGANYSFAVVTRDQPHYQDLVNPGDGIYETLVSPANQSPLSNNATGLAHMDNVVPIFWGVDKLYPHDEEKKINLNWDSAKDHTVPIAYRIWYSTWSLKAHLAGGGDLTEVAQACYEETDPTTTVTQGTTEDYCIDSETTEAIHYQIVVPNAGDLYSFLVRAYDDAGNHDDNTIVQMVLPKAAPLEPIETKLYLYNGTNMLEQTDVAVPVWPGSGTITVNATPVVWESNTTLTRESMVSGISIDVMVDWGTKAAMSLTAEFGYMDGASFVRLGTMTDLEVQANALKLARRVTRLAKFSLANYRGLVPAGSTLALRFQRWDTNTSTAVDLIYGDTTNKGQVLANVQPYNHEPNGTFAIVLDSPEVRSGGYIDIDWIAADAMDAGQTLHYDLYGSADDGLTFPYVIATDIDDTDLNGTAYGKVTWDTVGDGLTAAHTCRVRVELGDGFQYEDPDTLVNPDYPDPFEFNFETNGPTEWRTHNVYESGTIVVDNTTDVEPPAAITMNSAETRPKQGSVYLTWTAVGDDGLNHGTRVNYYDIRYRPDPGTNDVLSDANWDLAPTVQAGGEPVPGFSGSLESYELLGLAPMLDYDIGVKACDEEDNCSTLGVLSTSEGWRTNESLPNPVHGGSFYCGICHSTPPDEPDTKGIHPQHGYTLEDCAKCHGDGNGIANDVKTYDGRHYNGYIDIGWAKNSDGTHAPLVQIPIENGGATDVVITQTTDNNGDVTIYQDLLDGPGGYNMPAGQTYDDVNHNYSDSGTCINFGEANSTGCHGPFEPQWAPSNANPSPPDPVCSDCHGDSSAARDLDPYDRIWDCNDEGAPSELVKASPPIDNHGESLPTSKYTGAHEKHLNASFRFAKGDSCRLCHLDTMYSGEHADGYVDVRFDNGANQSGDTTSAIGTFVGDPKVVGMSCGHLSTDSCHDTYDAAGEPLTEDLWPVWTNDTLQCDSCHGMSTMGTVPHVSDNGGQACTWCHLAGHPQSPDGITPGDTAALLVNNNPAVGINYKSGGIHILKEINNRTVLNSGEPIDTLAEMCWGCHEDQSPLISEWGADDLPLNAAVEPYTGVGQSMYDFGTLIGQTSWFDATWQSADSTNFGYKTGKLQSLHSTDPTGVATVSWDEANGRYNEIPDPIAKIRCTNCHDVHDLNKADGDTVSGAPYLRGTWKSNPYEEDGAPWNKPYTVPSSPTPGFGAVPRAATTYTEMGGYFIDQNNVRPGTTTAAHYPTSGWTVYSSAGLCVLCHDADVDGMDKNAGEGLWLGSNGHSNSALGGTFTAGVNIFDYTHGRPVPYNDNAKLGAVDYTQVTDMAAQTRTADTLDNGDSYLYSYRSLKNTDLTPYIGANYAYNQYQWGATIDDTITDVMYHQFSCSKCHNPHASRLPKLMITNCLDIRHNTWDDGQSMNQTLFTNTTNDTVDRGMPAAYYATAQNCHRFDPARGDVNLDDTYESKDLRGGWNKVTPWVKKNDGTNVEHKGTDDPAYGGSSNVGTSPWQHDAFPTESDGW